uniref:Protein kinase domain-containing protein n=1 Tax=Ditylenchus dipsaci TaxID=166011 RepID=A0A915CLV3_9BILA
MPGTSALLNDTLDKFISQLNSEAQGNRRRTEGRSSRTKSWILKSFTLYKEQEAVVAMLSIRSVASFLCSTKFSLIWLKWLKVELARLLLQVLLGTSTEEDIADTLGLKQGSIITSKHTNYEIVKVLGEGGFGAVFKVKIQGREEVLCYEG